MPVLAVLAVLFAAGISACGGSSAVDTDVEIPSVEPTSASIAAPEADRSASVRRRRPGTGVNAPTPPISTETRSATMEEKQRAKQKFTEAMQAFDAGLYEAACPLFLEAYELVPGGVPLVRLAQCRVKVNDPSGACEALRAAKVLLEASPSPKMNARLEEVVNLRSELGCP